MATLEQRGVGGRLGKLNKKQPHRKQPGLDMENATKEFVRSEISPVRSDVVALKWMMGVNLAITLALFAVILAG